MRANAAALSAENLRLRSCHGQIKRIGRLPPETIVRPHRLPSSPDALADANPIMKRRAPGASSANDGLLPAILDGVPAIPCVKVGYCTLAARSSRRHARSSGFAPHIRLRDGAVGSQGNLPRAPFRALGFRPPDRLPDPGWRG